ncbi:EAL domain-containing response regulator [Thalassospira sp. MA62]|nr:EAL domain-containing response regulator [Thalassospira sp. MA62]
MNAIVGHKRPLILMVDGSDQWLCAVRQKLSDRFEFVVQGDQQKALEWLAQNRMRTTLVIADLTEPVDDGVSFLKQAAQIAPFVPRMVLSGSITRSEIRDVINQAAVTRVLVKPLAHTVLSDVIDRIISAKNPLKRYHASLSPDQIDVALDQGDFYTVLQPRYRGSNMTLCAAELLCRMPGLEREYRIDEIFTVCRDQPVINRLTRYLMAIMVDRASRYCDVMGNAACISVNLAAYSVRDADLVRDLIQFHAKMQALGVQITFELPELQIPDQDKVLFAHLNMLRQQGIAVMIDDFGAGNRSIELLQQECFAGVRLDRDLVRGVLTDFLDDAFVEWIVRFCAKRGLVVSAKGIESQKLVERLLKYGITDLQGFHLGRPVHLEEWEGMMAKGSV